MNNFLGVWNLTEKNSCDPDYEERGTCLFGRRFWFILFLFFNKIYCKVKVVIMEKIVRKINVKIHFVSMIMKH